MAKLLKLRRGTDTQHNSFTGAEGEVTVNTTNDTLHVHDGSTAGGHELARADLSNVDNTTIVNGTSNVSVAASGDITFTQAGNEKMRAKGNGISVTGQADISGDVLIGGEINMMGGSDANKFIDVRLGSNTLAIRGTSGGDSNHETLATFVRNGGATLYHNHAAKITTLADGVGVTGTVTCDGLQCDGDATVNATSGIVTIRDSDSTGTANVNYLRGRNSADSTRWYVGQSQGDSEEMRVINNSNAELVFGTNGSLRCAIDADGHFRPHTDDAYDLGTSTNQWRNGYFDGTVNCDGLQVVGGVGITGNLTMSADDGRMIVKDNNNTGVASTARIEGQQSNAATKWRLGNLSSGTDALYFGNNENADIVFFTNNADRCSIDGSGHFVPASNNTYDLGTSSLRWRNVYTNDLNLSNEGGSNDVDGTWGSWTIQEGEDDLFLLNRRNGKKYKFNLSEVN